MDLATPHTYKLTVYRALAQSVLPVPLSTWSPDMRSLMLAFAGSLSLLGSAATGLEAQRVHEIRLEAYPEREVYRFSPARVTARPGDVLLFRTVSGSPHSVVFESANLSGAAHEALNGAMSRRTGDLSSPLLSPDGAEYRIVVPALPPGRYEFFCLPHRAYDMRGVLVVAK
jgi:plastocyanin